MATAGRDALLLVADAVRTLDASPREGAPPPRAVLVRGDRIVWVGADPAAAPGAARRVDLDGAVLQPGFVNAHAHLTMAGLGLSALDLSMAASAEDCIAAVCSVAEITPGRVVWGSGWDETAWSDGRMLDADDLTAVLGDRPVILLRRDGHSALLDRTSLSVLPLQRADGVDRDETGRPTGILRREAARLAIRWFAAELPSWQLDEARRVVAEHLAAGGVTSVHEMSGPDGLGVADLHAWRAGTWPVEVVPYWGEADPVEAVRGGIPRIGSVRLDGTLGSHTAALDDEYADRPGAGHLYEAMRDVVALLDRATAIGVQVAFHAIGERACRQAADALETVASQRGAAAVRRCRHRLEHCTLVPGDVPARLGRLGVVAVVQPAYDALWGGGTGLYARRLGPDRAERTNPFGSLHRASVPLAFAADVAGGSLDPWANIRAAVEHHDADQRLPFDVALEAATVGGRRAARQQGVGTIAPGQRADLAAFALEDAAVPYGGRCVLSLCGGEVVGGVAADAVPAR